MSGYTMWIKIRTTLLCGMCCHRDQMGQIAADDAEEDLSNQLSNVPSDAFHVNTFFLLLSSFVGCSAPTTSCQNFRMST